MNLKMHGNPSEPLSAREVQLASLEILRVVDDICRREGLTYWLAYGTLIGAIRHKGFIPWDDDVDIQMPRRDYEVFLDYFEQHAFEFEPLVALNGFRREDIPFLITRISDSRYKMIGEFGTVVDELGCFIDIYPLDGAGQNKKESEAISLRSKSLVKEYKRYDRQHARYIYRCGNMTTRIKSIVKFCLTPFRRKSSEIVSELEALTKERPFEHSDYISCLIWEPLPQKRIFYEKTIEVPFEDMMAFAPEGYDGLLRITYGDYMQLPPKEQQIGHHLYSIVWREKATS